MQHYWNLVILLILCSFSFTVLSADENLEAIKQRIKPAGQVYVEEQAPTQTPANNTLPDSKETQVAGMGDPVKIYGTYCQICHASGAANAPKLTDKAAWEERSKKGLDVLVEHAFKGYNLMPPKGTCAQCNEEDIKLTVQYMLKEATGKELK